MQKNESSPKFIQIKAARIEGWENQLYKIDMLSGSIVPVDIKQSKI